MWNGSWSAVAAQSELLRPERPERGPLLHALLVLEHPGQGLLLQQIRLAEGSLSSAERGALHLSVLRSARPECRHGLGSLGGAVPLFDAGPPESGACPDEPPAGLGPSFMDSFIIRSF